MIMGSTIQFSDGILDGISQHLLECYPEEGCGFFAGKDGDARLVQAWLPVRNVQADQRGRRFQIAPQDYLKAEQWADDLGLTLLGIYHSHPDHPAIPSITDLENAVPWFSYLIVNTTTQGAGAKTSWQLNDAGQFEEELVELLAVSPLVTTP